MPWEDYPDDWDRLRIKVLKRDNFECTNCGKGAKHEILQVHHKTPISEGGNHSLSNLTTLCHPCHEDVHNHPIPLPGQNKIATPPCPTGSGYKCMRCSRSVSLHKHQHILKCMYCGCKILLKNKRSGINEIDVE